MKHSQAASVACACALWAAGSPGLNSQSATRTALAASHSSDPLPATVPLDRIRLLLEKSRGVLDRPEELAAFFERLHQSAIGPAGKSVHVLHFGDSHTAGDEWTSALRGLFQRRFGDGGSGFSLAGVPFAGYKRVDAPGGWSTGWKAAGLHSVAGDGYLGLGGVSIATDRPGESVFLQSDCDFLELYYLQQPKGGSVALYADGSLIEEFSTAGELRPEARSFTIPPGNHRFLLKTSSAGAVRLFGWVADKRRGVTYEALGLNGVRASVMLNWNEPMLRTYLERRDPALIVLAYGTNEAVGLQSAERYQEMFSTLLGRLRRIAPEAAILVIGPPDIHPRTQEKSQLAVSLERVILAQKTASRANKCAFWDLQQHMGGSGSIREWMTNGLAQKDYVHFSASGYRRIADALFADLMRYYEAYERVRLQLLGPDIPQ